MATISATEVKRLRDKTDASMMDCKAALTATEGDFDKAIVWLKEKYGKKLSTKGDRETAEGRIGIYVAPDGKRGGIVELRCESAPVAKNELFVRLSQMIAQAIAEGPSDEPTVDEIKALHIAGKTVEEQIVDAFSKLQENTVVKRGRRVLGDFVSGYAHFTGLSGGMLAFEGTPSSPEVAKDAALHAVAMKPKHVSRDSVDSSALDAYKQQVKAELIEQKKPEAMHDKIIEAKLGNFFADQEVLVDQPHSNADKYPKKSVGQTLADVGVSGVKTLVIYELGAMAAPADQPAETPAA